MPPEIQLKYSLITNKNHQKTLMLYWWVRVFKTQKSIRKWNFHRAFNLRHFILSGSRSLVLSYVSSRNNKWFGRNWSKQVPDAGKKCALVLILQIFNHSEWLIINHTYVKWCLFSLLLLFLTRNKVILHVHPLGFLFTFYTMIPSCSDSPHLSQSNSLNRFFSYNWLWLQWCVTHKWIGYAIIM